MPVLVRRLRPWLVAGGDALLAAALTVAVCWLVLRSLAGGAAGPVGAYLAGDLTGLAAAVAASTGAPLDWSIGATGGRLYPISLLLSGSQLALLVAGPLAAAVLLAWRARRRPRSPGAAALAAGGYAALIGGLSAAGAATTTDPLVQLASPAWLAGLAALAWAGTAQLVAAALPRRRARALATPARAGVLALVLVAAGLVVGQPAAAQPARPPAERVVPFVGDPTPAPTGYRRAGVSAALARVTAEQGQAPLAAFEPWRGTPSMLSLSSRLGGDVPGWLRRNSGLFGVADASAQLRPLREQREPTGERHVWFEQHVGGVPVYGSRVGVHLDATGRTVEFLTNSLEPDLVVDRVSAAVSAEAATANARRALPDGSLVEPAKLYLLPAGADPGRRTPTVLAWHVWLTDAGQGVSTSYFVDAATGRLVYALPRAAHAKNRRIYDLNKLSEDKVPVSPKRAEGDGPSGIQDVDEAYDHLGDTYDYFHQTFGRDSFDDEGGQLRALVRVRQNPDRPMRNAMFIPDVIDTMVFGEEMTKLDVVAHELTHGVTFETADLWYMYQSGALNESFSDIFAEAVEKFATGSNDWLVGTGIPGGPLRSMADPPSYGDPGHYRDFERSCLDMGGVHTNSGIQNKAFYLLSQKIGIEKAARIAYRTLTTYLAPRARFTDSRVGFIESANKLYGKGSTEAKEAAAAWTAVGVDGVYEQDRQDCLCIADTSLTGVGPEGLEPQGPGVDAVLGALLHVRDLFTDGRTPALRHYEVIYADGSDRAIALMTADDDLRRRTAHAMQTLQPVLQTVGTPDGDATVVTAAMLTEVETLLRDYAAADRAAGGGELASVIETELGKANFPALSGLTANQALSYLDTHVG
ncbi:M4 family metallopeptidase [Micromonospora sp. C28SCA-DRY-2]|uniref:M4 family metallopeptidase n=1 Tax=Micromonospora sp. C28SCA-DRY-2 TaxID=3059522 RepID=UPI0026752CB9|nr:M4 family metallopeptidase [Micromonospora sp. C28SCA-DRY-2]MDO3700241.1 M4 family metallopeptidase [Micromonospora sp. C28SCA-DRY-2]